jgi:hypothetical protein
MSEMITGDFNYGSVDIDTAAKLEHFARSGKALIRKSEIEFIARLGEVLSDARKLLASHNKNEGTFIRWATAEFDSSAKTIYNYVNAWERILCNGYTRYLHWSPTALYWASTDDLPEPVLKKLEELPTAVLVRASDVKRLIEASRPKPDPNDNPPFDDVPAMTPASQKKAEAEAAKELKKADAAAAKEKKQAEKAAEKEKKKAEAKAARAKARADMAAAKMAALPKDEQAKLIRHGINQHIGALARALDELHRVKPNAAARNASLNACSGIKLW